MGSYLSLHAPHCGALNHCVLYIHTTMSTTTNPCNYWSLWSNGQRYTFATSREMFAFSDQLARERRERIAANVTPWLPK